MTFLRSLPGTDLQVSALGLGTVKFGRNERVKYPAPFAIPDAAAVCRLLDQASELGINLLDTAPAYGNSEERLGQLLTRRDAWVLMTKVGEEFTAGQSVFDFSGAHTRASIERSLRRLRTDRLDIVLIHSDGNDEAILADGECVAALQDCKARGLIRAIGMSVKSLAGGLRAVRDLDVVMLTWNLQQQDTAAVALAQQLGKGVLVKKGLMSGHVQQPGQDLVRASMELILTHPGIHSMIVGTIDPAHLAANVAIAKTILGGGE
jgi:aryl-alcohol dehydrogenase-like predicted oxidoreductase